MSNQKKIVLICLYVFVCCIAFIFACSNPGSTQHPDQDPINDSDSDINELPYAESTADETSDTYIAEDVLGNNTFVHTVSIDLSGSTVVLDGGTAYSYASSDVAVTDEITVGTDDDEVYITSTTTDKIIYEISGSTTKTITVDTEEMSELYLDEVNVTASAGPALNISSSAKVFIVTAAGTDNTLSDAEARTIDKKASLYSKAPLIFYGNGELTINGDYKHGIFSADYMRVSEGTININVFARDAVRCDNGFIFDDGEMTIVATGTAIDDESKGIKVDGDESTDGAGKGFIVINGGYMTITSVSKGLTASWDLEDDAETADTSDDPNPDVIINNGVIKITTTGESYEYTDSNGDEVSCSPEGIEGKDDLVINNGYFIINTADDCLNAGTSITINDGYVYCASTDNDSIDSNGTLHIHGGVIVSIGADVPESAFDCDQNTFEITGGIIIGCAGSTSNPTEAACTQNVVVLNNINAESGECLALLSSTDECVFTYTIPRTTATIVLSSPDIATGTEYTVYTGGTAASDYNFKGMFLENLSYTPGTAGDSFTVSSTVTSIGTSTGGPNNK